jgi:threonine/homoserine/homoserine lactone efflux protein
MTGALFAQSLWIGVSIAAPVGPIGLLVIQRTLRHGRAVGLATGLGAAVADAAYGALGAFGVSALIAALQRARVPLALLGGAFLFWLAWRTWRAEAAAAEPVAAAPGAGAGTPGLAGAFAGTVLLTLSNPATILSFVAIFGAMFGAADAAPSALAPGWMVAGVFIGSAAWWLALVAGVGALRQRFDARAQRLVGRISALMLAGFAAWQWAALLR